MSVSIDGQFVLCDGPGCHARAKIPVALRRTLNGTSEQAEVSGWLHIIRGIDVRHYCSACKSAYLDRLSRPEGQVEHH